MNCIPHQALFGHQVKKRGVVHMARTGRREIIQGCDGETWM